MSQIATCPRKWGNIFKMHLNVAWSYEQLGPMESAHPQAHERRKHTNIGAFSGCFGVAGYGALLQLKLACAIDPIALSQSLTWGYVTANTAAEHSTDYFPETLTARYSCETGKLSGSKQKRQAPSLRHEELCLHCL